jgi:hypothetical protein
MNILNNLYITTSKIVDILWDPLGHVTLLAHLTGKAVFFLRRTKRLGFDVSVISPISLSVVVDLIKQIVYEVHQFSTISIGCPRYCRLLAIKAIPSGE